MRASFYGVIVGCLLAVLPHPAVAGDDQRTPGPFRQSTIKSTAETARKSTVKPTGTEQTIADNHSDPDSLATAALDSTSPVPHFFLITIGPGPEYWSAWGHTELLVRQRGQEDVIYSFGYFDFADKDFFSNFLKGRMRYFIDHEAAAAELNRFAAENRSIWAQALQLPDARARQLLKQLQWLDTDSHRYYAYDYFLANCTSQVRDLINQSVATPFRSYFASQPGRSWAQLTVPVANQGWLNLALHLGYGKSAWQPRNRWQTLVFPLQLQQGLDELAGTADAAPVEKSVLLYAGQQPPEDFWTTHGPLVFVSLFFLLAMTWPRSRRLAIKSWLLLETAIGVLLLALWLFTEHQIAAWNPNILLMWPLAVCLFFYSGRIRSHCFYFCLALYLMATVVWVIWAVFVGNCYLLPFAVLNALAACFLARPTAGTRR